MQGARAGKWPGKPCAAWEDRVSRIQIEKEKEEPHSEATQNCEATHSSKPMRTSQIVQATRRKLKPAPKLNIMPPLQLYRRILRAHQLLPFEQRMLGDSYVKSEFRLHRNVDNPAQIIGFLSQWQKYLEAVLGDRWQHESLDIVTIERMEPDKIVQLYELMVAVQKGQSEYNAIPIDGDKNKST